MTACTSFLVFFGSKCLAFAEKNTFPPRLLAVEAREAVRRQAIGKFRWQTAGLSTISGAALEKAAPFLHCRKLFSIPSAGDCIRVRIGLY